MALRKPSGMCNFNTILAERAIKVVAGVVCHTIEFFIESICRFASSEGSHDPCVLPVMVPIFIAPDAGFCASD